MKNHIKHSQIVRRKNDIFAHAELSILGAKCSIIANLVRKIAEKLQKTSKIAYLDASHEETKTVLDLDVFVTHKIGVQNQEKITAFNPYINRIQFSNYDLVLINGNHFEGAQQILLLDPEKEASVKKRLSQLTDIKMIIKTEPNVAFFDCLLDKFPAIKDIPCYALTDIDAITQKVEEFLKSRIPLVNGLVLAGGKSMRMGKDKTQIKYHHKPQVNHVVDLLEGLSLDTYVSIAETSTNYDVKIIKDSFVNLGAFGAVCSAFQHNPNTAWLVLASDLPFIDSTLIELLLSKRNPSKAATAIKGKSQEFMEPLITIYEPKAYPILLSFLSQGYACPRKMLINSDVEIIEVDDGLIRNVNTPEEYKVAIQEIRNS